MQPEVFFGRPTPIQVEPPPYLGTRLNWNWDVSVSCWKLPRTPLESRCNKGGWGWWEPPVVFFCILIYLGKYGWVACQFILDSILFLGWVGKVIFFLFFKCVKVPGLYNWKKQQQIKWTTTDSPEKAIWKKREKWKQNFRIPVNQSRAVSPDDEEIFELGALADQKESGCVRV